MKKICALMIILVFVLSVCATAQANGGIMPFASQVIDETTIGVTFPSGKIRVLCNIKTVAVADKLGVQRVQVYEKNGSSWKEIADESSKYGTSDDNYSYVLLEDATSGKEYKIVATFYGKIGSLTDTHTQTKYSTY